MPGSRIICATRNFARVDLGGFTEIARQNTVEFVGTGRDARQSNAPAITPASGLRIASIQAFTCARLAVVIG